MVDVSVIMPVYNIYRYPREWIDRAVNSVIKHQRCNIELCIGDDDSSDGTQWFLKGLQETYENVKVAFARTNTGGADACNFAAGMAVGKYFILLSCRSWYEPDSLVRMAEYLDQNPRIGFVYGNTRFHGENARLKVPPDFSKEAFKQSFISSFGYMYRREGWDAGSRYDCKIWLEEEKRYMTIADRSFVMSLIFERGFIGRHLDLTTLNYYNGGVPQMGDLLVKYKSRMMEEYRKRWVSVLGGSND